MKRIFLMSGIFSLFVAWYVLPGRGLELFSVHMTMHMLVVAVATPLLALAASDTRWDVSQKYPLIFAAIPASIAELIIVWGWHAPVPHHFARHQPLGLFLEQFSFILAGLWVWMSCLNPDRRGAGIIGLLLTSMHMTLLGALIGLAPRTLYLHGELEDQQLGGAIMLVVGGIVYLSGGVFLARHLLRKYPLEEA